MTVASSSVLAFTSGYGFGDHIGRFEAAEFTPSLLRAHVTARELASPPFEDVYIRACPTQVTLDQRRI